MRTLLWIALSILITYPLSAQQWTYGLKTGATLSRVTELPHKEAFALNGRLLTYEHAPVLQFHGGFWVQYALDQRQSLQAELLWTQQAYQSEDWFIPEGLGHLQFNYLSLPVLLRYRISPRLSAALGPQLSLLLWDRLRNSELDDPWLELNDDEIAWELGVNLEIGYQLRRWYLGLRAQRDLTPFYTIPLFRLDGTYLTQGKHYHRALHLSLGYLLGT